MVRSLFRAPATALFCRFLLRGLCARSRTTLHTTVRFTFYCHFIHIPVLTCHPHHHVLPTAHTQRHCPFTCTYVRLIGYAYTRSHDSVTVILYQFRSLPPFPVYTTRSQLFYYVVFVEFFTFPTLLPLLVFTLRYRLLFIAVRYVIYLRSFSLVPLLIPGWLLLIVSPYIVVIRRDCCCGGDYLHVPRSLFVVVVVGATAIPLPPTPFTWRCYLPPLPYTYVVLWRLVIYVYLLPRVLLPTLPRFYHRRTGIVLYLVPCVWPCIVKGLGSGM